MTTMEQTAIAKRVGPANVFTLAFTKSLSIMTCTYVFI